MHEAGEEKNALGYHLHRAFAALSETLHGELRAAGLQLTHPQFSVLRAVSRMPGLSQNGLARETGKDSAAISRSLNYLEGRGLIRRAPINGRAKGVFLTPEAEALRPLLEDAIRKTVGRACAGMDDAEVETAVRLLKNIFSALQAGAGTETAHASSAAQRPGGIGPAQGSA